MIEAELKARVRDPDDVRRKLVALAEGEPATYRDTYYDWPDEQLDAEGRELRLRTIETQGNTRHVLTYKQPPADGTSSKPEHETTIADPSPVDIMLRDLGLVEFIKLTKHCENFRFEHDGRTVLATLVTVPELDGTFLEVETMADQDQLGDALGVVHSIMADLGVAHDLDQSTYTGSVRAARQHRGR